MPTYLQSPDKTIALLKAHFGEISPQAESLMRLICENSINAYQAGYETGLKEQSTGVAN